MSDETEGRSGDWVFAFGPEGPGEQQQEPLTSSWRPGSHLPPPGAERRVGGSGADLPPTPPTEPPADRPRRSREFRRALAAALILLAGGIGFAFGHGTAGSNQTFSSAQAPATSPSGGTFTAPGSGGENFGGYGDFGGYGNFGSTPEGGTGSGSSNETQPTTGTGSPADVSAIAAKVTPGLVDVNSTFGYDNAAGAGTGIVLTSNGEVLTNNHVIDGATKISVTDLGNGKTYSATVLGYDSIHDVALLKLSGASGLKTATISSSTAKVGTGVVAIGNVGGTGGTPTSAGGSVTKVDQSITATDSLTNSSEKLTGLIETNADIQAGDSGGPLVTSNGDVIGMDTAALANNSEFSFSGDGGQGYAIPIAHALSIADSILANKGTSDIHVGETAFLGVGIESTSSTQTPVGPGSYSGFGNQGTTAPSAPNVSGAVVENTIAGDPAAKAGLVENDVITSVAGQKITSPTSVTDALIPHHPGDSIEIGWTDTSGASHTETVTLASGPPA